MAPEAWRSVAVVEDRNGEPHVLQQKEQVATSGTATESGEESRPLPQHRLVKLRDVVELG